MFNSSGLGQTISIVDRSGKVVSTSRHLLNIFNDAKFAYQERKAEIAATRKAEAEPARRIRRSYTVDEHSHASSRRSHRHGEHKTHSSHQRHSTSPSRRRRKAEGSEAPRERGFRSHHAGPAMISPGVQSSNPFPPSLGLGARSHTLADKSLELGVTRRPSLPVAPKRSLSTSGIDMDLAYGEAPPDLFEQEQVDETALQGLVGRARGLLDEANCLQHSVTQTVQALQKNPDAMAAVALTLAEISSLLKKMAPGALLQVRRMAPAVFALLSSPQFLIAGGVAVGVTIVALGGFKIVRKIQERRAQENQMEELLEIDADVSRIETWRRGVAESDAFDDDTSVEAELISPTAARLGRLQLVDNERMEPRRESSRRAYAETMRSKSVKSSKTGRSSKTGKTSKSRKTKEEGKKPGRKETAAAKKSPLRLMFRS